ncbi:MAG TPA: hypothetical protein VGV85_01800, partial [Longimicrobiaceae bacterium]|nr:hypothetical protein [Longimicrobiaceae bacterium]
MFDDLKNLFSKTWDAFQAEAGRSEPEDQVAELLSAMRREMVEARATVPLLEEAVTSARSALERERRALTDVERRRGLAERIGDAETVRVADDFAGRHRARIAVLEDKVRAAEAERDLRKREVAEMSRQYKDADANRFALLARLRTTRAQGRMGAALGDDAPPFADLGRMGETLGDRARCADALDELEDLDSPPPPPRPTASDMEERLRELKRRMCQE